jgi:hypothetical protein
MAEETTDSAEQIIPPDFYRERLKLYERTLKH